MDIATQKLFAEVLKDKRNTVAPYSTTAKVKNITEDTIYVVLSGSDITTPIKTTNVSVNVGDTVDVIVSHEDTRITGNRTDVAASSKSTEKMAQTFERSNIEMANKLDIVGNEITAINNTIELLNNEITIKDSDIEVINSSIVDIDSKISTIESDISTQGSKISTIESDISTQGSKISTIESDISTQGSKISTIESDISTQGSKISAIESDISAQESKISIIGSHVSAQESKINTIESNIFAQDAKIYVIESDISTQGSTIETINSDISILNSAFTIEDGKLTGISEIITDILESDYVTTDFLNADVAWIVNGKIKEGAIGSSEIADASITTAKIKELSADVIKAGTLSAERLILTTDEEDPETGEKKIALITAMNAAAETEEGGLLDGAIISDKTINAAKINVVDLKAFGATIGNFKIETSSMYNAKKSLKDPTNGVYIGTDGIALGQGSLLNMTDDSPFRIESDGDFHLGGKTGNFINFDPFTGELEINAKTIKMGSKSIPDLIDIGGRNLLVSSYPTSEGDTKNGYSVSSWASVFVNHENLMKIMEPSTTYTLSYKFRLDTLTEGSTAYTQNNHGSLLLYSGTSSIYKSVEIGIANSKAVADTWEVGTVIESKVTFTTPSTLYDEGSNYRILSYTRRSMSADGSTFVKIEKGTFYDIKLEKGNKATDWTPAPEDLESYAEVYADAKFEILDNKISSQAESINGLSKKMTKFEQDSEGFTWTIDETAIVSSVNEYYESSSPTELLGGSWSTDCPTWTEGTYIWMRAKNTNGKGESKYTEAVCITGNTGADGTDGKDGNGVWTCVNPTTNDYGSGFSIPTSLLVGDTTRTPAAGDVVFFTFSTRDYYNTIRYIDSDLAHFTESGMKLITGADGKGVGSIKEQYYHSTSRTELAGGSWSDTAPTPTVGKYIWTRTVISYTSGNPTTTSAICVTGDVGAEGSDGVGVTSVDVEYYLSTSPTSLTGGSWQTTAPTISSGTYLWSRSKVTYTSGDPKYTEAYCVSKAMAESIDVGGRNLLLNSKGPFVLEAKNTGNAADNYNYYRFYSDMITGEIYTISADIEVLVGSFNEITVYPYPGGTTLSVSIPTNGRITKTFTKTAESIDSVLIYAGLAGETRSNSIRISNVKIEKGNKATDWTPAPEDIYQAIEDVEVGGVNLLSDTNIPSMTKKAGPGNKYLSDSSTNSSYMSGSFVAISDPPIPNFTHAYQFECETASSIATAGRSLCFYNGAIAPMIDGETYTMSMYARKVSGNGKIRFMIGYDKYPNYNNYVDVTSKWEKYSYTFTYYDSDVYNDSTKTGGARCYFGASCAVTGTVQICGCKLEKGDKATDWCPSAADSLYANNYMHFADNGLTIGNMTASTLGRNVLIDLDSVDIRNGSEVLASYGENIVLRHAGKDVFTIKDSTFLNTIKSAGRLIEGTSEGIIKDSSGNITSITLDSSPLPKSLSANTTYVWHIKNNDRYAIFSLPSSMTIKSVMWRLSSPAFLYVGKSDGTYIDIPCSYCDNNAVIDTVFKGSVWIENDSDISGIARSIPPLGIGTVGGEHMEIDNNEIHVKTDEVTPGVLYLNMEGGPVSINNNSKVAFRFEDGVMYGRRKILPNDPYSSLYDDWKELLRYDNTDTLGEFVISSPQDIRLNPTGDVVNTSSFVVPNGSSYIGTNASGVRRNNFQPCNTNNNCVIGYGSYSANEGSTNIYGMNMKFFVGANGTLTSNRKQKVLWTGAYYMSNTHSIALSENVSDQLNGIVLEWSYYENGTAADGNYVHHFIPKAFVEKHSGADVRLFLGAGYAAYKIVYITNTKITGNIDNDDASKSYYGLTVNNNKFVLRNVYGV